MFRYISVVFFVFAIGASVFVGYTQSGEDPNAHVQSALEDLNSGYLSQGLAKLRAIGAPAVPAAYEYARATPRLLLRYALFDFIQNTPGDDVSDLLRAALDDDIPQIRGFAVRALGARKDSRAVPKLLLMLDDTEVAEHVTVDDGDDYDLLVRDAAVRSLEAITGRVLAPNGSRKDKADAWRLWGARREGGW